jgi:hypothetical protein
VEGVSFGEWGVDYDCSCLFLHRLSLCPADASLTSRSQFALTFWDIIFAPVDGVFETPYQSAPLDLSTDAFAVGASFPSSTFSPRSPSRFCSSPPDDYRPTRRGSRRKSRGLLERCRRPRTSAGYVGSRDELGSVLKGGFAGGRRGASPFPSYTTCNWN